MALLELSPPFSGTVLDPACGEGALLKAVLPLLSADAVLQGIELDPLLLARAQQSLQNSGPQVMLALGDALERAESLKQSCDVVVANPPYLAWHRIPELLRHRLEAGHFLDCPLPARPRHADQQPDLSLFFLVLGVHALKPGGRLAFLMAPEWWTAPRAAGLRGWLLEHLSLHHLVLFGPQARIFAGDEAMQASTGAMILVGERRAPAASHTFRFWRVQSFGASRAESLARLELQEDAPGVSVQRFEQSAFTERPWKFGLEGESTVRRPQGHHLRPIPWVSLESVPGLHIMGGHQPRVQWLDWLELDLTTLLQLPDRERVWAQPALRESGEICGLRLPPPSRWWVIVPREWTEAQLVREAPVLHALMRARAIQSAGEQRPEKWWHFPNPRNLRWHLNPGPCLLLPRTAPTLRAVWDDLGHHFKGTNTAIRFEPESAFSVPVLSPQASSPSALSPQALWGLLNARPMQVHAGVQGRSYHGRGILLEPAEVRRLDIPSPLEHRLQSHWRALDVAARAVLEGMAGLEQIDERVTQLFLA